MRILLFSQLYPNARQPYHGIFVENRLRHLLAMSGYEARVLAPVPWAPPLIDRLARYRGFRGVPHEEERHGIRIDHPRYVVIPKAGMNVAPFLLYAAARRALRRMYAAGERFDLIDAHFFYPDGVAAALLAREFDLPFTVTGRGTDLNLIPRYRVPRALIRRAASRAAGLITVCAALADDLAALGVPRERVAVLRNGVDLEMFRHDEAGAAALRRRLSLEPPVYASVGHLIARKAHHLAIEALAELGAGSLLIAGRGEAEKHLRARAAALGLADRVHFLGGVPHAELKAVYSAADLLFLASTREGWPNVLLEALACGTPVVATAVNGSPEVVREPVAGEIVSERSGAALAAAAKRVRCRAPDRRAVRRYAEGFSWDETSRGQMALFERIVAQARPGRT